MATTSAPDQQKIKDQIEFYFSDSNFPRDKFLRAVAAQSEQGYVPIATLLTFAKLKALSEDPKVIAEAIKGSELVAANEDGTQIKRVTPLPEVDTSTERTIYAKGWKSGTSIDTIKEVLGKFGKVLSVRVRKTKDKKSLKDSVFVEFSTVDEAKAALAEPIKIEESVLLTKMRQVYIDEKKALVQKLKEERAASKENNNDESEKKSGKGKRKESEKSEREEKEHPKGVLLSFKNIGGGVTREILKEIFEPFGAVAFVDFSQNEPEGIIRFEDPEVCKKAFESVKESKKEIGNQVPELSILSDSEETAYWEKVAEKQKERKNKGGRGGRGGGRGGKRGGKRQRF